MIAELTQHRKEVSMTPFKFVDADNHYYESTDAFTRHGDQEVKRFVQWHDAGNRRHLVFGHHIAWAIPNPTFNPIAKPGAFFERLRVLESGARPPTDSRYGLLEPTPQCYQNREARLSVMDEQDVERTLLFPTLALTVEHIMKDSPRMLGKVFHAFNEWLDDDWGFNHQDRIYAPPHIMLHDADFAVGELQWALDRGAKVISLRPGPCYGRTHADPYYDRFWGLVNESKVLVGFHATGGTSAMADSFNNLYAKQPVADPSFVANLRVASVGLERPVMDTLMALVFGNLFGRFPNVRVASIEMGGTWVPYLLHALDHGGGIFERKIEAFGTKLDRLPSEVFREHVYVSPFPEEDIRALADVLGPDRILMGSDWPHPEGTPIPRDYRACLEGFDEPAVRQIMRDNALALVS